MHGYTVDSFARDLDRGGTVAVRQVFVSRKFCGRDGSRSQGMEKRRLFGNSIFERSTVGYLRPNLYSVGVRKLLSCGSIFKDRI